MKNNRLWIRIIASVLIALSAIVIIFIGELMINKTINSSYDDCPEDDRAMFQALSEYLSEPLPNNTTNAEAENLPALTRGVEFNMPVLIVHDGFIRGGAYLFNFAITEHSSALGLNGGVYAVEILLPEDMHIISPYRMALFTPMLSSLIFSPEDTTLDMYGTQVPVICFNEDTLNDGSFALALDALFENAPAE